MANNTTSRRNLVSLQKFCDMYDITERTGRSWIAQGKIHGYRLGDRLIRVDLDEVERDLLRPIPTGWGQDVA